MFVRPVLNLTADTPIVSGTGAYNDPYRIIEPSWHYIDGYASCPSTCQSSCQNGLSMSNWSCTASYSTAPAAPSLESGNACWCKY